MTYLVADIFDRLATYAESNTDVAIGKLLGISRQAIANARKRNVPPFEKICNFAISEGISIDYLLLGKDEKKEEPVDIDIQIFKEVVCEFEMVYKAIMEKNETAEWMNLHDFSPEEAKTKPRPKDEEIQSVCDEVNEKAKLAAVVGHLYNAVIGEQDEKERRKIIMQNATIGLIVIDPSTDTAKVFNVLVDAHIEESEKEKNIKED